MFSRLFRALDDFLIDHIFQPICDALRKLFGWTKDAPMGISFMLTIICYMPLCILTINDDMMRVMGWMMAAWIIYCSWLAIRLIQIGTSSKEDRIRTGSTAMNASRVILFAPRIASLLVAAMMIPFLIWLIPAVPSISFMLSTFTAGIIFDISALYFHACTDLPPGKTVLAKIRERIAESFAKPVMTGR
jgi:hypothetical protein